MAAARLGLGCFSLSLDDVLDFLSLPLAANVCAKLQSKEMYHYVQHFNLTYMYMYLFSGSYNQVRILSCITTPRYMKPHRRQD